MLLQTGYLTIRGVEKRDDQVLFYLDFTNREIQEIFEFYLQNAKAKTEKAQAS